MTKLSLANRYKLKKQKIKYIAKWSFHSGKINLFLHGSIQLFLSLLKIAYKNSLKGNFLILAKTIQARVMKKVE